MIVRISAPNGPILNQNKMSNLGKFNEILFRLETLMNVISVQVSDFGRLRLIALLETSGSFRCPHNYVHCELLDPSSVTVTAISKDFKPSSRSRDFLRKL